MLTLSICIPSYNRFEKLGETIKEILKSDSNDFEVVVVDNCSPRNIDDYLSFNDHRIRIVKRTTPVIGTKNIIDSLLYGKGKYSLLLLDKDTIKSDNLEYFINLLSGTDVYGGYCKINSKNNAFEIKKHNTLEKFGFKSKHPSGDFYDRKIISKFLDENAMILDQDPFNFDICMAYCASKGAMLYFDYPLIVSTFGVVAETNELSLTFDKKKGNLYYLAENRISEFHVYLKYIQLFNLNQKDEYNVLKALMLRTLEHVTFEYRSTMSNSGICHHYGHSTEKIGLSEMTSNMKLLLTSFKRANVGISRLNKTSILLACRLYYIKRICLLFASEIKHFIR